MNGFWWLPNAVSKGNAASWLLNGWQLSGITQFQSGNPWSVLVAADPANVGNGGQRADLVVVGDSAVDRSHAEPARVRKRVDRGGDLRQVAHGVAQRPARHRPGGASGIARAVPHLGLGERQQSVDEPVVAAGLVVTSSVRALSRDGEPP